jgi:asparagine synthase (glutamine-hydrolysing)
MCGILGIVGRGPLRQPPESLRRQRDALAHRGPDDVGEWWSAERSVALLHRRLAIVDLSAAGHQPMSDPTGRLHLVFNGEIYNYRSLRTELCRSGHAFRSSGDTEVILAGYHEWGDRVIDRLEGMFAFALWDEREGRLLLARDRAGEKPLFYRHAADGLHFASELKALLLDPDCPRTLDVDALNFYLAYGYVPGERCMVAGFHKLPPAHAMVYEPREDRLRVWRYWSLPEPSRSEPPPDEELLDECEALLERAVRRQLHADVPLGILLSGGVDSSLVTAMAARAGGQRVRTFTVTFPGAAAYDEGPHARRIAGYFDADHTELVADDVSVDLLPRLAAQYDEPIADSSMIPTYLVSSAIRRDSVVALGGDGGDELFGGYGRYTWAARQRVVRRLLTPPVAGVVGALAGRLPLGVGGRTLLMSLGSSDQDRVGRLGLLLSALDRGRLVPALRGGRLEDPERFGAACAGPRGPLIEQLTRFDFLSYLPEDILVKVDRASMLVSLEVRAPFLDREMIEFAFGRVPDRLRARGNDRKVLLRRLAARVLPSDFDAERKRGFAIPLAAWYRGRWGSFMQEVLEGIDPGLFDRSYLRAMSDRQTGRMPNTQRLFALVVFELWRRAYRIALPGS